MAASKAQKEQAARMLAAKHSETETASAVGVSRSTIQHWKRQNKFIELIDNSSSTLIISSEKDAKSDNASVRMVLERLETLKCDEAAIGKRLWALFDKLETKTTELLEATETEELSPRQIPQMVKASIEIAQAGIVLNDRIAGIEALVDGFKRIK